MPGCLKLWGIPECGWTGECVQIANSSDSFCLCEQGWSQTEEMNFFVTAEDLESSICIYHKDAINTLYSLGMAVVISATIVTLFQVKKCRQLRRLIPYLLFTVIVVAWVSYRIASENALLGHDFAFSFMFTVIEAIYCVVTYTFYQKLLSYIRRKADTVNINYQSYARRLSFLKVTNVLMPCLRSLFSNVFWIATFTDNKTSLILIRSYCGFAGAYIFTVNWIYFVLVTELMNDMKKIVAGPAQISRNGSEKLIEGLQRAILTLNKMRFNTMIMGIFFLIMWGILPFFDIGLLSFTWLMPLIILLTGLMNLVAAMSRWNFSFTYCKSDIKNKMETVMSDVRTSYESKAGGSVVGFSSFRSVNGPESRVYN